MCTIFRLAIKLLIRKSLFKLKYFLIKTEFNLPFQHLSKIDNPKKLSIVYVWSRIVPVWNPVKTKPIKMTAANRPTPLKNKGWRVTAEQQINKGNNTNPIKNGWIKSMVLLSIGNRPYVMRSLWTERVTVRVRKALSIDLINLNYLAIFFRRPLSTVY